MTLGPTAQRLWRQVKMIPKVRQVDENAVKGSMSLTLPLFSFVEMMEIVSEEAVKLLGRRWVVASERTPLNKLRNCIAVLTESAGGIGCFNKISFRTRHCEKDGQQDWRWRGSTGEAVAAQTPAPTKTNNADDAEVQKTKSDP
jgi:hypothetical protein